MKKISLTLSVAIMAGLITTCTQAGLIVDDWLWADQVANSSSHIQNYLGTPMESSNHWWLTGSPDGDLGDYVAGWRSNAPDEFITMSWQGGISDLPGDDLVVCFYGGPKAAAIVSASIDGTTFTEIGTIGGGTPGVLQEAYFDFGGHFGESVSYVKVERAANGSGSGTFFDAFGAIMVPEPGAILLLSAGLLALGLFRRPRRRLKA